jgi:hypothetical protein
VVVAANRTEETFVQTLARGRDVFNAVVRGRGGRCDLGDLDPEPRAHIPAELAMLGIAPAGAP